MIALRNNILIKRLIYRGFLFEGVIAKDRVGTRSDLYRISIKR